MAVTQSSSTAKRIAGFAAMFVIVPLIAIAVIEGLTSAGLLAADIAAIQPAGNFRKSAYDTLVGWVGIPNLSDPNNFGPGRRLTHNADGMRIHRPVTPTLAANERRIICSGDSFTYGSGVGDSDTFCAYLEQHLPGVQTLNMAQPGYGIDQAYLWYKRDGGKYPHQVHVFAFIWNDFERMALTTFSGYAKPIIKLKHDSLVTENIPVPAWEGMTRLVQTPRLLAQLRTMQLIERNVDGSTATKLRRVDEQVWSIAEAVFNDLVRINKERGSQLVLLYLPTDTDLPRGPYETRRKKLAEFSEKSGIPLIDLTDEMRQVDADSVDWYFITRNELDLQGVMGHYTPAGHRWTAARLAEHLQAIPAVKAALEIPGTNTHARLSTVSPKAH